MLPELHVWGVDALGVPKIATKGIGPIAASHPVPDSLLCRHHVENLSCFEQETLPFGFCLGFLYAKDSKRKAGL